MTERLAPRRATRPQQEDGKSDTARVARAAAIERYAAAVRAGKSSNAELEALYFAATAGLPEDRR